MCCHGCVPGCCSCPCSAPPASANGAKVSGAVVALPATSPWGLCVPVLGSRSTSPHVESTCCVLFLLFSISPAFGDLPCYQMLFCSQFPLAKQNLHLSVGSAFLTPSTLFSPSLVFPGRQSLCAVPGKELHRVHPGG